MLDSSRQVASGCLDAFDAAELTPTGAAEAFATWNADPDSGHSGYFHGKKHEVGIGGMP